MADITELIAGGLAALGLPEESAPALAEYERLLLEKNEVMNLTAITDPEQAARLHYLDCAALLTLADFKGKKVIDVGTGAGFPGLVLKLCEPSVRLTLLDSLGKRVSWLSEISVPLGAPDAECIHGRAEEYGLNPKYREKYDIVTSRAVADMRMLAELCLPFVKVGGFLLAMKSVESGEELRRAESGIRKLGGVLRPSKDYPVPGTDVTHRLVIIEKVSPTPKGYPRKFARIKAEPL